MSIQSEDQLRDNELARYLDQPPEVELAVPLATPLIWDYLWGDDGPVVACVPLLDVIVEVHRRNLEIRIVEDGYGMQFVRNGLVIGEAYEQHDDSMSDRHERVDLYEAQCGTGVWQSPCQWGEGCNEFVHEEEARQMCAAEYPVQEAIEMAKAM